MSQQMTEPEPAKKSKAQVFGARLFSTLLMWAIVTAAFVSGNAWVFMGLVSVLSFLGVLEYFQMTKKKGMPSQPRWGIGLSFVYLVSVCSWLGIHGRDGMSEVFALDILFIVVLTMGSFLFQLRREVQGHKTLMEIAMTLLGFVYVVVLFNFLQRLLFIPENGNVISGAWLIIWLVIVTKFADMGAYITGSLIGKHKMIPHISPGKTWEGFGGALVFSLLGGCLLFAMLPEHLAVLGSWQSVIILSLVLSVLAILGDLAESVVKRSIGIKDSGKTLPGIGGALDLIDSICFTAPVLFFVLKYFYVAI